jgi:hypothetical protein
MSINVFKVIDADDSSSAKYFKKRFRDAFFFAVIGVISFVLFYVNGMDFMWTGLISGLALGMSAAFIGSAVNRYKKETKNK